MIIVIVRYCLDQYKIKVINLLFLFVRYIIIRYKFKKQEKPKTHMNLMQSYFVHFNDYIEVFLSTTHRINNRK